MCSEFWTFIWLITSANSNSKIGNTFQNALNPTYLRCAVQRPETCIKKKTKSRRYTFSSKIKDKIKKETSVQDVEEYN